MSAIAWATVKTALHAWVTAESGLDGKRVVFAGQNIARPPGDGAYIALRVTAITSTGRAAVALTDNPDPTPGADEFVTSAISYVRAQLRVTCFPPREVTDASEATAILQDVVSGGELDSVQGALDAAGCPLLNVGDILTLDGVFGSTRFEPRAMVTAVLSLRSTVAETVNAINTVEAELHVGAATYDFEINLES